MPMSFRFYNGGFTTMVNIFLNITFCCNHKIRPSYYQKMLPPYHVQLVPWTSDLSTFAHYGAILSCGPSKKPKTTLENITTAFWAEFSKIMFSCYRLGPWISPTSFFPSLVCSPFFYIWDTFLVFSEELLLSILSILGNVLIYYAREWFARQRSAI